MIHTRKLQLIRKYKSEHFLNDHIEHRIQSGTMLMPLGLQPTVSISLDRVCAKVEEIEEKDGEFLISFKVLDTPLGRVLQGLLDADAQIKIFPSGIGSVDNDVVKDDYKLAYFYIGSEL